MNSRIIVFATAALMFAAPLSGAAEAGNFTNVLKQSIKGNAQLVKKGVKEGVKESIEFNKLMLHCSRNVCRQNPNHRD
jgi:hypothetical protein